MSRFSLRALVPLVLLVFFVFCVPVFAQEAGAERGGIHAEPLPTIGEATRELDRLDGLFALFPDPRKGKVWMELPPPGDDGLVAEVLWVEGLLTGLGSNPVGLDRGQMGAPRLLEIRRVGDRVVFVEPNLRYVASSDSAAERRATRRSFATSVLWGARIAALDDDGTSLVDLTSFIVRDAHGVSRTLKRTEQGTFQLDPERSYVDFARVLAFPENLEFEAVLTWAGDPTAEAGELVERTAPDPYAVTLVQHQSLVALPEPGYEPRAADPRMGFWSEDRKDYAVPLDESMDRPLIGRHRLEKIDPDAERSRVVEPIVYYVDPGAPEPVRSALLDGARWWAEAFEAAGFLDAYRVEILPQDAHPLDLRYNVIQWVHRRTRGWSYGNGLVDPRTGEILKGHVTLGSLRVRQDRRIFEAFLGTEKTGSGDADDPVELALARIRQLAAHEVGHTLGLTHNFAASTYGGRASVMDYPAPLMRVREDGGGERMIDVSQAYGVGLGAWDVHTIRWGYGQFPPGADEAAELEAIVREGLDAGYLFLADADARPPGASDPRANLWDNGADPVEELENVLAVRALALERFGEGNVTPGTPLAHLQEVLAPLYFHPRYQLEAAAKAIGGMEYHYALRGDGQVPTRIVDGERQRRALEVVLSLLEPETLELPQSVLRLLAPRPFGEERGRELFGSETWPAFDSLGAAATTAQMVASALLQPERLARIEELHARDRSVPSTSEVMDRLLDAAVPVKTAEASHPRHQPIRRQVERVVVRALMDVAAREEVRGTVRSQAVETLRTAADRLEDRPEGRGGVEGRFLAQEIERFLERPWTGPPAALAAPAPPPGSPIGGGSPESFGLHSACSRACFPACGVS